MTVEKLWKWFRKLINNDSSLNKANRNYEMFGYLVLICKKVYDFISPVFTLVLVLIKRIYHTLKTVFHHISKFLKVRLKYSAVRHI